MDPAAGLLSAADLRGDVLASQALQALLAAAGAATEGDAQAAAVDATACLLRATHPSSKVLAALATQLQAGGSGGAGALVGKLPAAARQALKAFVGNHAPAAAGAQEEGTPEAAAPGSAAKRKRPAGGSRAGSAALQQQILGLLSGSGQGGSRPAGRPPRPAAAVPSLPSAATTAAATTAAATSAGAATATTSGQTSRAAASTRPLSTRHH